MQNKPPDGNSNSSFDLDKIEIPAPSVDGEKPASHESPKKKEPQETIDAGGPRPKKPAYFLLSLLASGLVIAFSILWLTNVAGPPGTDKKADSSGFNELYAQIGPIRINSEEPHFRLTLTVKCASPASKEKVTGMDAIITKRLVSFLKNPYTHQIIADRDYSRLKIKIKTLLNDVLGETLIEDVYIAEIMLY